MKKTNKFILDIIGLVLLFSFFGLANCNALGLADENSDDSEMAMLLAAAAYTKPVTSTSTVLARIRNSANVSAANGFSFLTFDTEDYDTGNFFSTSSPTIITIPSNGIYSLVGALSYSPNATGVRKANFIKNDPASPVAVCSASMLNVGGADSSALICSATLRFTAGETLKLQAYQNSGGALNIEGGINYSPVFTIARIAD